MKKLLAMLLVVLMLCTVTGIVLADPQDGGDIPFTTNTTTGPIV